MKVIHFRSEEYPDTQGLYIEILQIDCDTDQFYERNVMNTQEMVWNGQKAVYMKQNHLTGSQYEAGTEGKEVAVFLGRLWLCTADSGHGNGGDG